MEDLHLYLFLLKQSQNKGYMHCAAQIVLDATRFYTSLPGDRAVQYKIKLRFLREGRIVDLLASCMDYDIEKFRKACISELDKQYYFVKQKTIQ